MEIELNLTALTATFVILTADVVVFVTMYCTLGRAWRRHEDARKTAGITAVLLLALAGVPFGLMDFGSWLFLCALFAVAGTVATSLKITEQTRMREQWERERMNGRKG